MPYDNNLLLDVLNHKAVERPPIWVMRQAGRILPGYRQVRASVPSFKHLVKHPELIAQVSVEPLDALGVDAAILFSDILVIPEAMGLDYEIVPGVGPVFSKTIQSPADVDDLLSGDDVLPHLDYVFASIATTKTAINGRNPLIGFSGAPWTLFAYMIEGGGSKTFAKARRFLYEHPKASHKLMGKIASSITAYLKEKIKCGVDVVQLFDSWADMLSVAQYQSFCLPYIQDILAAIQNTPKIFFPKGAWSSLPDFGPLAFDAISIDWKTPPSYVRDILGDDVIIQGNFDPCMLYASPEEIATEAHNIIDKIGGNHIFNLGHGVYPDTDASHVKALIDSVKAYRY